MNFLIEFDYLAEEDDELTVQKGDIVNDVQPYEDGWMIGNYKGKRGVFPSNFGKQIQAENIKTQTVKSNSASFSNEADEESHKEIISDEAKPQPKKVLGVGFGDIFSGKQIQLKHTVVNESKNQPAEDESKPEMHSEKKIGIGSTHKAELVKAIYQYKAENLDELEIEEGDIITVIDKKSTDEGWWKGKLNGKVGVFPNNFVVAISADEANGEDKVDSGKIAPKFDQSAKPARPVAAKTPPPLPLTAKPIANKPKLTSLPVRPPITPEISKISTKISSKSTDPDPEEINFESSSTHKLLVGPNAERVRRQNIRPPKKSLDMNNTNDDKPISPDTIKPLYQKEKSVDAIDGPGKSPGVIKSSITREKTPDNHTLQESKVTTTTTSKTSALKDKFSDNVQPESTATTTKHVSVRERSKDIAESVDRKNQKIVHDKGGKDSPPAASTGESTDTRHGYRPRSQLYGGSYQTDNDQGKIPKSEEPDALKKKVLMLESRISAIEDDNITLRDELKSLRKTSNDQIVTLTNIVNKLLGDFDIERDKRKSSELKLTQLKEIIDDLDLSQN